MTEKVEMANDEGSDPTTDFKTNKGKSVSESNRHPAQSVSASDPEKTEKLAKAGNPDRDPDAGTD